MTYLINLQSRITENFHIAFHELTKGKKETHWCWFMFPQLSKLGTSPSSKQYGVENWPQACRLIANESIRETVASLCTALLLHDKPILEIMGNDVDVLKVQSSLTLLDGLCKRWNIPEDRFNRVLQRFYDGRRCEETMLFLAINSKRNSEETTNERIYS